MVLLLLCFPLLEAEPVGTGFWKLWFPGFQPWLGAPIFTARTVIVQGTLPHPFYTIYIELLDII